MKSFITAFGVLVVLSSASVQCKDAVMVARKLQGMRMMAEKSLVEDSLFQMNNIEAALAHKDAMTILQQSDLYREIAAVMESIKKMDDGQPMNHEEWKNIKSKVSNIKEMSERIEMSDEKSVVDSFWKEVDSFVTELDLVAAEMKSEVGARNIFSSSIAQFMELSNEVENDAELRTFFGDSFEKTINGIYDTMETMFYIHAQNDGSMKNITVMENERLKPEFFLSNIGFFKALLQSVVNLSSTTTTSTTTTTSSS